jgi:quercetin dioxygenase-like cupin family protein
MVHRHSEEGYRPASAGIVMKNLVQGEKTTMLRFKLAAGSRLPAHSHPHEQTGFVVRGKGRFTIAGETSVVGAGDSWCIPGGVEHAVEALEDCEVIEVFSPLREAYLA